jgi:hypothetical protein
LSAEDGLTPKSAALIAAQAGEVKIVLASKQAANAVPRI